MPVAVQDVPSIAVPPFPPEAAESVDFYGYRSGCVAAPAVVVAPAAPATQVRAALDACE